jgi:hypothetical protein
VRDQHVISPAPRGRRTELRDAAARWRRRAAPIVAPLLKPNPPSQQRLEGQSRRGAYEVGLDVAAQNGMAPPSPRLPSESDERRREEELGGRDLELKDSGTVHRQSLVV